MLNLCTVHFAPEEHCIPFLVILLQRHSKMNPRKRCIAFVSLLSLLIQGMQSLSDFSLWIRIAFFKGSC